MDNVTLWFLLAGVLLISMGLLESVLQRLPVSSAMLYLVVGFFLGPSGFGILQLDPQQDAVNLTLVSEIALLISLFAVGLKLRIPLSDRLWHLPVRLGVGAMLLTIPLLTVVGVVFLHLPLGAAILLGAILAPTDPVLASDVQIKDVGERDTIRFSLSGEGGLNDGTTLPFIMLGLALLDMRHAIDYSLGNILMRLAYVLWGIAAGIGIGWGMGWTVGRLVTYLRHAHRWALGMEEFLALGVICLAYGLSNVMQGIGFLAVFAAGVALRNVEHAASGPGHPIDVVGPVAVSEESDAAVHPDKASAYMTEVVMGFNQKLEHIAELVMAILLGNLISSSGFSIEGVCIALVLFLLVRPLSATLALAGAAITPPQRNLMAWFGIRGVGSVYYLVFTLQYPWPDGLAQRLVPLVLTVVAMSVFVHGISSTPLMANYYRRRSKKSDLTPRLP